MEKEMCVKWMLKMSGCSNIILEKEIRIIELTKQWINTIKSSAFEDVFSPFTSYIRSYSGGINFSLCLEDLVCCITISFLCICCCTRTPNLTLIACFDSNTGELQERLTPMFKKKVLIICQVLHQFPCSIII